MCKIELFCIKWAIFISNHLTKCLLFNFSYKHEKSYEKLVTPASKYFKTLLNPNYMRVGKIGLATPNFVNSARVRTIITLHYFDKKISV